MGLLIIDNYDSFTFNLVQLVEEAGCMDYRVVLNDRIPEDLQQYDKILISPGPGLPSDIPHITELIRNNAANRSVLGICLGHQCIIAAFGGKLMKLERILHGEACNIHQCGPAESIFRELPSFFPGGRYHSWVCDPATLPEELRITALDSEGHIMAISHRKYDVKGLQFHPESIMTPHGRLILMNWLG